MARARRLGRPAGLLIEIPHTKHGACRASEYQFLRMPPDVGSSERFVPVESHQDLD